MYFQSFPPARFIPIPGGQSNCTVWTFLICPLFLILRVIVFCFACKYLWAAIIVKCIYQKWTIGRSCKTKQKKENNLKFLCEKELYWLWSWPVNRRFCTRGWRPSKRSRRTNRIYTICEKQRKTAMWTIPLGSNSVIAFMTSSISSLCYLVEGRSDWLVSSELDNRFRNLVAR